MARERKAGPGKRKSDRIFQYQGFWLCQNPRDGVYFVNWYDPAAKHTRRSSTRSRDLERAKQKLFEAAHATPPDDPLSPAAIDIAAVQRFYSSHHVKEKGKGIRDKSGPRQAFAHLSRYLASVGAAGKVADLTLAHQVAFMKWCRDEQKLSSKTIKTYL